MKDGFWRYPACCAAAVATAVLVMAIRRTRAAHALAQRTAADRRSPRVAAFNDGHLDALPEAISPTVLAAATQDDHPRRGTAGIVVHPRAPLPVFDHPGGTAIAQVTPAQLGGETWLPVIDQRPDWVRVLLPARPNGATGWLDADRVTAAHHRYEIHVQLKAARMRLFKDGHVVGGWPISTGTPGWRIPEGRTFLLAAVRRPQGLPPLLWYLAAHAAPQDPPQGDHLDGKLVALHRWPANRPEPTGRGCIRVSDDAQAALAAVPLGCLVRIHLR